MGIRSAIKSVVNKVTGKKSVPQLGKVLVTPSEATTIKDKSNIQIVSGTPSSVLPSGSVSRGGSSGGEISSAGLPSVEEELKSVGITEPVVAISAGAKEKTIAQQLKTSSVKAISPYDYGLKEDYKKTGSTGWEATKASVKNIPSGLKQSFSEGIMNIDPLGGISYIIESFERTGKVKEEKEIIIPEIPWRGTKIEKGFLPLGMEGFKGTYGELAEKRKMEMGITQPEEFGFAELSSNIEKGISKELTPKYQEKIDTGELTLPEAQEKYKEEFIKRYEEEYKIKGTRLEQAYLRIPTNLNVRTGESFVKFVPSAVETGALVGASLTPAGAIVGSTYIFGRGFKSAVESPTMAGKALGVGTAGLGLAGFGASIKAIGRSITIGEIKESIPFNPSTFAKPSKSLRFELSSTRSLEYSPQVYKFGESSIVQKESLIGSFQREGNIVEIRGVGGVLVKAKDFWTGKPVNFAAGISFKGLGVSGEVAEEGLVGFTPSVISGKVSKEFQILSWGKTIRTDLYKGLEKPTEEVLLGAVSRKENNLIYSMSGELELPKSFEVIKGVSVKAQGFGFNVEDFGITRVIKRPSEKVNVFIGKEFKGISTKKRTPLSTTFGEGGLNLKPTQELKVPEIISTSGLKKGLFKPVKVETGTRLINIPKTRIKLIEGESLVSASLISSAQGLQLLQPQKNVLSPSQKYKQVVPIFSAASALGQRQEQKQRNFLVSSPAFASASKFRANVSPEFSGTFGGGLFIPLLGFAEGRGKGKLQLSTRGTKYKPSLRSIVFNIKSSKIPKSYYLGAGDITPRPIISASKKYRKN